MTFLLRRRGRLDVIRSEMVMYFRWQSLPELADLPPDRRKEVWREAMRDPFRASDFGWLLLFLVVVGVFAIGLLSLLKSLPVWIGLPAWIGAFLVMGQIMNALMIYRYRPAVRRLRAGGG